MEFGPQQLALVDLLTLSPGEIGWVIGTSPKLILRVTSENSADTGFFFVELNASEPTQLKRIGNLNVGEYSVLKVPGSWKVEVREPIAIASDLAHARIALSEQAAFLCLNYASVTGSGTYFLNLTTFAFSSEYPYGQRGAISAWKIVLVDGDKRTDLAAIGDWAGA